MQVERTAGDMLAVLGYAEGRARKHRVGLGRSIGRKNRCSGLATASRISARKIDYPHIDLRLSPE